MRLLFVGNYLSSEHGSYPISMEIANRLEALGWHVIRTSGKKGRLLRLMDMLLTTYRCRSQYQAAHIDLFSGPAFLWAEAVCFLLRALDKPYILTLHGGGLPRFARRQPRRVSYLLNSAAALSAPSEYLQRALQAGCNIAIRMIPNPLDLNAYHYRQRDEAKPRLVWLRAYHEVYNPLLALQVVHQLKSAFPTVHLLMIGPDKQDGTCQMLQQYIRQMGLLAQVEMFGAVSKQDVPAWLNKGDVFLNTTNVDNTPVTVIEAMATGLCVISTNVGGIPDLLADEVDALLVPPRDPVAMAQAVTCLLTDKKLAGRLSRNARQTARSFDWSIVLPQWESLFHDLVRDNEPE